MLSLSHASVDLGRDTHLFDSVVCIGGDARLYGPRHRGKDVGLLACHPPAAGHAVTLEDIYSAYAR